MPKHIRILQQRLVDWYAAHRRDLPWRVSLDAPPGALPDPYHVLVSEAMLQQTQVITVIPYFRRFVRRFPAMSDLASADEQEVLRVWQGLGYYRRAWFLHATAKIVVKRHAGKLPTDIDQLLELPGVGRYTAGAIASLAYNQRQPAVDGNVERVLCRIDRIEANPREPAVREQLWQRAAELLPKERVGDFNSAIMELGATICTPRGPQCLLCPIQKFCKAFAGGVQKIIPPARKARPRPIERRWTFCIRHRRRWLIERRPDAGRWAGLWQFPTVEATDGEPSPAYARRCLRIAVTTPRRLARIVHNLTHRRYEFDVFVYDARSSPAFPGCAWVALGGMSEYPLARPHLRIAELLASP